eukprot:PhM_4_TR18848/c1_g1_i3/m.70503
MVTRNTRAESASNTNNDESNNNNNNNNSPNTDVGTSNSGNNEIDSTAVNTSNVRAHNEPDDITPTTNDDNNNINIPGDSFDILQCHLPHQNNENRCAAHHPQIQTSGNINAAAAMATAAPVVVPSGNHRQSISSNCDVSMISTPSASSPQTTSTTSATTAVLTTAALAGKSPFSSLRPNPKVTNRQAYLGLFVHASEQAARDRRPTPDSSPDTRTAASLDMSQHSFAAVPAAANSDYTSYQQQSTLSLSEHNLSPPPPAALTATNTESSVTEYQKELDKNTRDMNPNTSNDATRPERYPQDVIWLYFLDETLEQSFSEFVMSDSDYAMAKVLYACFTLSGLYIPFSLSRDSQDTAARYYNYAMVPLYIVYLFFMISFFWENHKHPQQRETHTLRAIFVYAIYSSIYYVFVTDNVGRQMYIVSNSFTCFFLSQVRLHRLFKYYSAAMVVSFASCLLDSDFRNDHTLSYIAWMLSFLAWAVVLFFIEREQRMSFCQVDTNRNELKAIENHIEVMQDILATFFPRTPTRDLLAQRVETYSKPYPGTALIVTDISGFTAWSTRTEPRVVIDVLARLMYALESASPEYNVERVYTVGDSFVGAVFPMSSHAPQTDTNLVGYRCVQAILFGVAATQQPHKLGI